MLTLVTGASGFIGSHLIRALKAEGFDVRALVHKTPIAEIPGVSSVVGDILDAETLAKAMANVDIVFHLAAAVGSAVNGARAFQEVNVSGTRAVLAAARNASVKRIIHFSSIGVLGAVKAGETADETYRAAPVTPYDQTKFAAEKAARLAAADGVDVVIVRPGWVYGLGDRRTFKFINAVCSRRLALVAGAKARQTPVYIDDLIAGVLLVCQKGRPGVVYHLAGDEILTAAEMTHIVATACGVPCPRFKLPRGVALAAAYCLEKVFSLLKREPPLSRGKLAFFLDSKAMSSAKAKKELGYAPRTGFSAGIVWTIAWYREKGWL
jgi:nucleoside-diphosphate-sugar epimerase